MYTLCAYCLVPHKLPAGVKPEEDKCHHCGGHLVEAEPVMCRACFQQSHKTMARVFFIPKAASYWVCPSGHRSHKITRPGSISWASAAA